MMIDRWRWRAGFAILWIVPCFYYINLLTLGSFRILRPISHFGLVFNSMLLHLLAGRFDVDPGAIGVEAFVRHGQYIAYFGIFGALLRLPLLLSGNLAQTDITTLSIAVAVSLNWLFRLAALFTIIQEAPQNNASKSLIAIFLASEVLNGEGVQFLRPSIYQEVICWAMTLSSCFIWLFIRYLLSCSKISQIINLSGMTTIAGLALITRPSTGLGLYIAIASILLARIAKNSGSIRSAFRFSVRIEIIAPAGILLVFALGAGFVNFERWGNPLMFIDMRLYAASHSVYIDRLERLNRYGEFNVHRILFGIQYYFFPLWQLVTVNGRLIWQNWMRRFADGVELPPGSLLLTDPVSFLLAGFFLLRLASRSTQVDVDRTQTAAALLGLAVPAVLILIFIYFAHRYRMEFYPFLDTASLLGFGLLLRDRPEFVRKWTAILSIAWIVGTFSAHCELLLYRIMPLAPATDLKMGNGLTGLIKLRLEGKDVYLDQHVMP